MPDLMSHLVIGLILAELFNIKKKSLVVLGALTPDLLSKTNLITLHFGMPLQISTTPFHTTIVLLLASILIAPLFRYSKIKTIIFFNTGALSHFLSDITMKHFTIIGTRLLYPFSRTNYTLNLIWPEQSVYILVVSLFIYIAIRIYKKNKLRLRFIFQKFFKKFSKS